MSRTSVVTIDDIPGLRQSMTKRAEEVAPFPVTRIRDVEDMDEAGRWLVDDIWPTEGVGLLAGSPKTGKTWVALELGIAVASGKPFLGSYPVPKAGPVLMFGAEDRPGDLKARVVGICNARAVEIDALAFDLIDIPSLTLDRPAEFARLQATVKKERPALVILDPFVRLFRGSENDAGAVSRVLGQLRALQREFAVAVLVVHHVRKHAVQGGAENIRGSGDFHAWADSSIVLRRRGQNVADVKIEHRRTRSPEPFRVALAGEGDVHLEVVASAENNGQVVADERTRALSFIRERRLVGRTELREHLQIRNERVGELLEQLCAEGLIVPEGRAWAAAPRSVPSST